MASCSGLLVKSKKHMGRARGDSSDQSVSGGGGGRIGGHVDDVRVCVCVCVRRCVGGVRRIVRWRLARHRAAACCSGRCAICCYRCGGDC